MEKKSYSRNFKPEMKTLPKRNKKVLNVYKLRRVIFYLDFINNIINNNKNNNVETNHMKAIYLKKYIHI